MKYLYLILFFLFPFLLQADPISLNTADTAPYSTKENNGFYDVLLKEVFRDLGLELKINHYPSERSIQWANEGHDDGEFGRISGLSNKYNNLIEVREPLVSFHFVAIADARKSISDLTWSDLAQYRVAYLNGWKIFEDNVGSGSNVTKYNDIDSLFNVLLTDRVDLILFSKLRAEQYIKNKGIDNLSILAPPLSTRTMHLYLNKSNSALADQFSQGLLNLKNSGRYEQIVEQYLIQ